PPSAEREGSRGDVLKLNVKFGPADASETAGPYSGKDKLNSRHLLQLFFNELDQLVHGDQCSSFRRFEPHLELRLVHAGGNVVLFYHRVEGNIGGNHNDG